MPTYKNRQSQLRVDRVKYIDYKNVSLLKDYLSQYHKIVPRYYNGNSLKYQKMVSRAIKNARIMGLLPFTRQ